MNLFFVHHKVEAYETYLFKKIKISLQKKYVLGQT